MVRVAITSLLALAVTVHALAVDSAGAKNVGLGNGKQFIGGECLSGADCASTCCATLGNQGICSAVLVANTAGKTGCGFVANGGAGQTNNGNNNNNNNNNNVNKGGAGQNNNNNNNNKGGALAGAGQNINNGGALAGAGQNINNGGAGQNNDGTGKNIVGAGNGQQSVPNQCASDADCKTGCCAQLNGGNGVCSGPAVANESGKSGCGFVDQNFASSTVGGAGKKGKNGQN